MPDSNFPDRAKIRELVKTALGQHPEVADQETPVERVVVNSLKVERTTGAERDESARDLITADDLRGLQSGARLRVAQFARFTPSAEDMIAELGIEVVRKQPRDAAFLAKSVAIGADHGGFKTKQTLKQMLGDLGLRVEDVGTHSEDAVDYPDLAHAVARLVSDKKVDIGIIIDGAGIGSAMAANKTPGVRAAACYSTALAKNSREHNGANVLTLGAGQNSPEEISEIVKAFLTTDISENRHKKRVAKIDEIDRRYRI